MAGTADRGQRIPKTISHYRVGERLGGGGMGVVFRGTDRRDGSLVAIKLLHPHLADDESFRERFEREAHIGALLHSPYAVRLLDYGVVEDRYFIVMEFVEGQSLKEAMAGGPLDTRRALRIMAQVARALEEAAARGVVHRDIKPDNILLSRGDSVKVADFGIAKQVSSGTLTMPGAFVGTLLYAAPELSFGRADHRSDIYSLGATLFHALTGHPPFQGDGLEVLHHHSQTPVPMERLAGVPAEVAQIIARCMEKDPARRYQFATELAGDLQHASTRTTESGSSAATVVAPPPVNPLPETLVAPPSATAGEESPPAAPGAAKPRPPGRPRKAPSWLPAAGAAVVVVALAVVALVILGGGGGNKDGGTAEAAGIGPQLLRRMVLAQAELGPDFATFALNPDTSGYVFAGGVPGQACAAATQTAAPAPAPVEAYDSHYESEQALVTGTGTFLITDGVENYADEDAAGEALRAFLADPSTRVPTAGCPVTETLSRASFTPATPGGDADGVEVRLLQTFDDGTEREFTLTVVGFTRETVFGKVMISHFDSPDYQAISADLAAKLDARIEQVLAEAEETPDASRSPRPGTPSGSGAPASGEPTPPGSESPGATTPAGQTPRVTTPGTQTTPGSGGNQPPAAPGISALGCSPGTVQTGQTISCSPATSGSVTSRAWSAPGGSPSSGSGGTFSVSYGSAGVKTISLTACNGQSCSSASQQVTVGTPPPAAPAISSLGCSPSTVEAFATVSCSPSVSGSVTSYSWSAPGGSPGTGGSSTFATGFASAGGFTITLTACNGDACTSGAQGISVTAPPVEDYEVFIDSATIGLDEAVTVFLFANSPSAGIGFYDIDIYYDPAILFPIDCSAEGGGCDIFFTDISVNLNGVLGSSGSVFLGSITFQGIDFGTSFLDIDVFTLEDAAANDVTHLVISFGGQITVQ